MTDPERCEMCKGTRKIRKYVNEPDEPWRLCPNDAFHDTPASEPLCPCGLRADHIPTATCKFAGSEPTIPILRLGDPQSVAAYVDARVAEAVREERERIAKIMCEQCSQGIPLEDGGRFHHPVSDAHVAPRYLRRCDAAGIRAAKEEGR